MRKVSQESRASAPVDGKSETRVAKATLDTISGEEREKNKAKERETKTEGRENTTGERGKKILPPLPVQLTNDR